MGALKLEEAGLAETGYDIFSQKEVSTGENLVLDGYRYAWIELKLANG